MKRFLPFSPQHEDDRCVSRIMKYLYSPKYRYAFITTKQPLRLTLMRFKVAQYDIELVFILVIGIF